MTQHTMLMLVAAPLLAFGQPFLVWLWSVNRAGRTQITRALLQPAIARSWQALAVQRPAGLFLGFPAGVVLIVLGLALFSAWLGESERRVRLGATDAIARALVGRGPTSLVLAAALGAAMFVSACDREPDVR